MAREAHSNYFVLQKPSRKKVANGDIFAMQLKRNNRFLFGRVINDQAILGGNLLNPSYVLLIYIYKYILDAPGPIPDLRKEDLLIQPGTTDRHAWSCGAFVTVDRRPLSYDDRFEDHCFRSTDSRGGMRYYNEQGVRVEKAFEPCGPCGLDSYDFIGHAIYAALGFAQWPKGLTDFRRSE